MAIEICKKCGYPNQKGAIKCSRCGNILSAGQLMGLILVIIAAIGAAIYGLIKLYLKMAKKNGWPIPGFITRMEEKRARNRGSIFECEEIQKQYHRGNVEGVDFVLSRRRRKDEDNAETIENVEG